MSFSPHRLTQQFVVERQADIHPRLRPQGLHGRREADQQEHMVQRDVWRGQRGNRKLLGPRRPLVGRVGVMSLKEARDKARDVIAQMGIGLLRLIHKKAAAEFGRG